MKPIDCRGLACPAPVLTAKQAIEANGLKELTVVVDNEAARQNVSRFLESQHFVVSVREEGKDLHVTGRRKDGEIKETVLTYTKRKIKSLKASEIAG